MAALAEFGPRPMVKDKLAELEGRERCLTAERHYLETAENRTLQLPESTSDLSLLLQDELQRRAIDSYEFGEFVRQLVPHFHVYLVRLIDGGHPLSRAKVHLNLLGSFTDAVRVPGLEALLSEEFTLELSNPPQRERIREEVVRLTERGFEQRQVAVEIAEKPKQAAVWKTLQLHKRMQELQVTNPYVMVYEPPDDYAKLRRHKNKRYNFEPLEGYVRPML
jgi:hypothetical protein